MKKADDELVKVLGYILNRADIREIDALEAAIERRRKALSATTGISSLDPERAAKEMSGAMQASIEKTMGSLRKTFRGFALDLLEKEAPELSELEKERLVDSWVPQNAKGGASSLVKDGKVAGIPCDMMDAMARQFVAYSMREMPSSDYIALRRDMGDWPSLYWRRFPRELQRLIKGFISGEQTRDEFEAALSIMLSQEK